MLFALFLGCAGNIDGVCVYTTTTDATSGSFDIDFANVETCTDYLSKLGCRNSDGEFTKGATATEECVSLGYSYYCEEYDSYVKNESDCPTAEE